MVGLDASIGAVAILCLCLSAWKEGLEEVVLASSEKKGCGAATAAAVAAAIFGSGDDNKVRGSNGGEDAVSSRGDFLMVE